MTGTYVFYDKNGCAGNTLPKGKPPAQIPADASSVIVLTASGAPIPNDEARSVKLSNVPLGHTLTVFDSPGGDRGDDWCVITALQDLQGDYNLGSFEPPNKTKGIQYQMNDQVLVIWYYDNGLDGKVSRLETL